MRVMFVFMTCFFIGIFICIIKFNLDKGQPDNKQKDTPKEKDKSYNVVNIVQTEDKDGKEIEIDFNEDCTLDSVDGINDDINMDDDIEFPDYLLIYSLVFDIERIINPPVKTYAVLEYIRTMAPQFYPCFKKFGTSVVELDRIQNNLYSTGDNSSHLQQELHLFYMISTMYELINDKELTSWLVVEDYKSDFALLGVYLNYSTIYYLLYETDRILELCFFNESPYINRTDEIFENDEIKVFAKKIQNILEKTSEKLYKETKINIGLFEDKTGKTNGMNILSIYDIDKITNFVKFTMFQALFLIFGLNKENKICVHEELRNFIHKKLDKVKDAESSEEEIVKVEKSCQNIYGLFYDKGRKYKKSWVKDFENCVGNLKQLFEKAKVID